MLNVSRSRPDPVEWVPAERLGGRERGGGLLGRLERHLLGLVDQRAHPIRLASAAARFPDPQDHLVAAGVGEYDGAHRGASRRQLVDHRDVEVRVRGHRERPRDRRRRHDQLMRPPVAGRALLPQTQPLVHAEAMLLVDDRNRERGEFDALLEQRVRADHDPGVAAAHRGEGLAPRPRARPPREQRDRNAERFEPPVEIACVLVGEQFRRRHQCDLSARLERPAGGERGDQGLAAADVALHEPKHRRRPRQVGLDLTEHVRLRGGEAERE